MARRRSLPAQGLPALALAGLAAYGLVFRSRQLTWGATPEEMTQEMPGDACVANPHLRATRAITIRNRASEVWPWIAQLGQGRGGFYSYDGLENLVGCDIHSADRVVPEWQTVAVGDQVRLAPDVPLVVAVADPGHALILTGGVQMGRTPPPYDFSWAFVLLERPDGTTRLLVRERYHYTRWWAPVLIEPLALLSFVMTQKMLRGVSDRAEGRRGIQAGPGD